jgi:hypothetical protein
MTVKGLALILSEFDLKGGGLTGAVASLDTSQWILPLRKRE